MKVYSEATRAAALEFLQILVEAGWGEGSQPGLEGPRTNITCWHSPVSLWWGSYTHFQSFCHKNRNKQVAQPALGYQTPSCAVKSWSLLEIKMRFTQSAGRQLCGSRCCSSEQSQCKSAVCLLLNHSTRKKKSIQAFPQLQRWSKPALATT